MIDSRSSSEPFGIFEFLSWDHSWNHNHNSGEKLSRTIAALKESGATFVRFDFLWSDLEPSNGRFDFDRYDHLVDQLAANQIGVLGILAYTPSWIQQDWRQAPDARYYSRYARRVVHRYKDRVRHWEIWHEPDSDVFWQPQDNMLTYTRLLRQVYSEMKAEDPTCLVHLGGLSKALPGSLREIYEHGGRHFFDTVQFQAFANPRSPQAIGGLYSLYEEVRRIMSAYGDQNKDVWLTQIGCPGMKHPHEAPPWWLGANLTEEQQAAWLTSAMAKSLEWPGVTKVFWSYLRDTDRHFHSGGDRFGLLRQNFSKKPAFYAFQKLVHAWRSKMSLVC